MVTDPADALRIMRAASPHTMVVAEALRFTIECATRAALRCPQATHEGAAIFECGVWKGGCSLAMALAQQPITDKPMPIYMFDSFQGLPPARAIDGPKALAWQADTESPFYFNNCRADAEAVNEMMLSHGLKEWDFNIVPGWFEHTLRHFNNPIALLRLDCDWYDPMRYCLDKLMPQVITGATVIIDDYYAWDGCARAVHDYLAKTRAPYRIRTIGDFVGAYFVKEIAT